MKLGVSDQKCVRKSGYGFVVVEGVDGQQLGDVNVNEDDVAVCVKCCLKMIKISVSFKNKRVTSAATNHGKLNVLATTQNF